MAEKATYCRICEAFCGLIATIDNGQVTKLRPDPDHLSAGFACPKGVSYTDIHHDADRLNGPLKRQANGTFAPVSWDQAIAEIGDRLKRCIASHGGQAVGIYAGNPMAYNDGAWTWAANFIKTLKSRHYYTAASVDVQNRWISSGWMYGNPLVNPLPDIDRTDFLFIIGANPLVSHFSMVTVPAPVKRMRAVLERGGRVLVVDPRRTETARQFEWLPIRPDGDAWLLLAMLQTIFAEGLDDKPHQQIATRGLDRLKRDVAWFSPERCQPHCGISADVLRGLARDVATASSVAFHGRCGASLGAFSTLVAYLIDVLAIVTGNFDRPGGLVFGEAAIDIERLQAQAGNSTVGTWRSRIGGFPEVLGTAPAVNMAAEIATPGPGQLRSLFVFAGNPIISTPQGDRLAAAMQSLDLTVVFDIYPSDTALLADFILPGPDWLERENWPSFTSQNIIIPHIQWADAVVPPRRDSRPEWWVLDQIARRAGFVPNPSPFYRMLDRLGLRLTPRRIFAMALRMGKYGDKFGWRRSGLNLKKLALAPRGIKLLDHLPTGVVVQRVKDGIVRLDIPEILAELDRIRQLAPDGNGILRLISQRELRSQNTYFHNSATLMKRRRWTLKMNPVDAAARQIADGDIVDIASRWGRITAPVALTRDMIAGAVALPHGWGKKGGGRLSVAAGGGNYNLLTPTDPHEVDRVSGNARLNGIEVVVVRVGDAASMGQPSQVDVAAASPAR